MHIFMVKKRKVQILKGGVTGQTTQEFLKPFYKEIENDRFLEKTDRTKHTHKVCRMKRKVEGMDWGNLTFRIWRKCSP